MNKFQATGLGTRPDADSAFGWTPYNLFALFMLTISTSFNYLDRSLLGFLLPLVQAEYHLTDTEIGLVNGLAFTLLYTALTIPMAWLGDATNRRNVIAIGFGFWSLMVLLTGYATSVVQLVVARLLTGAGEATSLGPTKSITADIFSDKCRPAALSIIAASSTFSGLALVPCAGWIADHYGWRSAFIGAGACGLAVAAVILALVREPPLGGPEPFRVDERRVSILATLRFMKSSKSYLALASGCILMTCFSYVGSAWETTFLVRVHHLSVSEATVVLGPVRSIAGIAGLFLGAYLSRRLGPSERRRALVLPIAALGAATTEAFFLLGDNHYLWMAALVVSGVFLTIHLGVGYNLLMIVVMPRMRGMAVAVFVLLGTLIGQSFGPPLVGFISDELHPSLGALSIRFALLVTVVFATLAAIPFGLVRRWIDRDVQEIRMLGAQAEQAQILSPLGGGAS